MRGERKVPLWVYAFVLLTALSSLASLYFRHRVEDRNRAVALAADIDTVQALAASQGLDLVQGLRDLKAHGLTTVVVPEEYVAELLGSGELQIVNGKYISGPSASVQRVLRGVRIRFPSLVSTSDFVSTNQTMAVEIPDLPLVRGVAVGLNPDLADTVRAQGLEIIARCANPPSASDTTVDQTIVWTRELGAETFLPEGTQVLGRKDSLDAFIKSLRDHGMTYASPEFAKIGGDENVVDQAPDLVIRLHAAQAEEMDKMRLPDAIDRYAKAARERNQRILLLRPLTTSAPQPLTAFGEFIHEVELETEKEGGIVGEPHPFSEPDAPHFLYPLIAICIIPVGVWTVWCFFPRKWLAIVVAILGLALAAACYKQGGRPFMALLAAITFPTVAFLILDRPKPRSWLFEYVFVSLISLTGGLAVAGLLNSLAYYIHAKQFLGVKFAHFFPILLVGCYFIWRFGITRKALKSPVEWGKALLALVIVGALAFMIERTGNDNPAAVSDLELKARALLDAVLFVRPRTKEFLIGHPALIIGTIMLIGLKRGDQRFANWKGWITLFLMLGAIGQTSIVNTMCHIHTPLTISLARIGVGFVLGGIIGAVLWGVIKNAFRRPRPSDGLNVA